MANSFVRYTGNGNTTTFSIPFTYINSSHLSCTINGVATAFTLDAAGTTATTGSTPAVGAIIEFKRSSSATSRLTDYVSGGTLTESDLDTDSIQAFNLGQEALDQANDKINYDLSDDTWDANNKKLKNIADPVNNQDVATKYYIENTWLSTANKTALTNVNSSLASILAVNNNASNINAAVSNATNINTVAGNIAAVNTVSNPQTKDEVAFNDVAGHAYFARAWSYFRLVTLWGDLPLWLELPSQGNTNKALSPEIDVYAHKVMVKNH